MAEASASSEGRIEQRAREQERGGRGGKEEEEARK